MTNPPVNQLPQTEREAIARIILGPKSSWNYEGHRSESLEDWLQYPEVERALAKADQIIARRSSPTRDDLNHPYAECMADDGGDSSQSHPSGAETEPLPPTAQDQ
jgi:hypothetical protein